MRNVELCLGGGAAVTGKAGCAIAGATHIPLHDLPGRLNDAPPGEVWVYCHSGYRAMAAASLLAARGGDVISVNNHFTNAASAGIPLERG